MESNALELSTNVFPVDFLHELLWFGGLSESLMLLIAFYENHFDSFPRIFSISGSMQLSSSILNISRYGSKGYASVVLGDSEVIFLGEDRM